MLFAALISDIEHWESYRKSFRLFTLLLLNNIMRS